MQEEQISIYLKRDDLLIFNFKVKLSNKQGDGFKEAQVVVYLKDLETIYLLLIN